MKVNGGKEEKDVNEPCLYVKHWSFCAANANANEMRSYMEMKWSCDEHKWKSTTYIYEYKYSTEITESSSSVYSFEFIKVTFCTICSEVKKSYLHLVYTFLYLFISQL